MKKKKLYIFISIIIFCGIFFLSSDKNIKLTISKISKNYLSDNIMVFFRVAFNNNINTKRTLNDYNTEFLPFTHAVDINFSKINIKEIKKRNQGYVDFLTAPRFKFHLSQNEKNVFIASSNNLYFFEKKNLSSQNLNIQKIETNFSNQMIEINDILVDKNRIFISAANTKNENCSVQEIYVSEINSLNNLNFKKIFSSNECAEKVQSGQIQLWQKNSKEFILLSVFLSDRKRDENNDRRAQNDNSISSKILLVDLENGSFQIYSKGHRNTLGLYADNENNLIINTENGPRGGDEINLIKENLNYGWDVASYGWRYTEKKNDFPKFKLDHESHNFEEPIFSFVPSVAPSDIIKIDNNFSNKWHNNFLMGTLNYRHLIRLKFNKSFTKLIFYEDIFIGERIRDLIYLNNEKIIILALEDSGSLGILQNMNND